MNWLDTQTQELLQRDRHLKLAPPKTSEFGLLLLQRGMDYSRLLRAICLINNCSQSQAAALARQSLPVTINSDINYEDALLGQFELICCDAISAFISSEVLEEGDRNYQRSLLDKVIQSPEFKAVSVTVVEIPKSESGERFADQFLGITKETLQVLPFPFRVDAPFKKVRIMKHWAGKIGVRLDYASSEAVAP